MVAVRMRRPQRWRDRTVSARRSHALCRYFLERGFRKLTLPKILGGLALIALIVYAAMFA